MSLEESPLAQEQLESAHERSVSPLNRREWAAEAAVGGTMLAAAAALALIAPAERGFDPVLAVLLTIGFAIASRVEFDVAGWYTVASQMVLVPMLFVLPPSLVPLLAVAGLVLASLPEVFRGARPVSRLALAPSHAWFALGAALVLVVAGAPDASDAGALLLLAALAAQFALDFAGAAVRNWIAGDIPLRAQLREGAWIYSVDALLAPVGLLAALAAERFEWAVALLLPLMALLELFAAERRWRIGYIFELSRAYRGTATLLGDVVEADHAYTGDHSREVLDLSLAVADELGLSPVQRRRVEFGALLHDVGKLAVPKSIIDKAGPLDDAEWQIIRRHTIEGEAMLRKVGGVLADAGEVVRASHERYDGAGYPDGLRADRIPIEARIVSCCDAYSAMTTTRAYRRARSPQAALAELRECAGTQFDPAVVHGLIAVVESASGDGGPAAGERRFARATTPATADAGAAPRPRAGASR